MAAAKTTGLTRGDKTHKKFMDKLNILRDNVNHGYDSLKAVHKQTVDASVKYTEAVAKGQEQERKDLYDIIKNSEDEKKIQWAKERIQELDCIKEKEIDRHNEFLKEEGDEIKKNIVGGMMLIAVSTGLISSKHVRQMGGKAISSISKNLLHQKK